MNWAQERRLDYIDFRMVTCGWVSRSDLIRTFGISLPQASTDLGSFLTLYPDSLVYDKSAKLYKPCAKYKTRRGFSVAVIEAVHRLQNAKHPLGWL